MKTHEQSSATTRQTRQGKTQDINSSATTATAAATGDCPEITLGEIVESDTWAGVRNVPVSLTAPILCNVADARRLVGELKELLDMYHDG